MLLEISVYLGRNHLTDRGEIGLSRFILEIDPDLDAQIQAELKSALEDIQGLPTSLGRRRLDDETKAQVLAAQETLRTVRATVDDGVLSKIGG